MGPPVPAGPRSARLRAALSQGLPAALQVQRHRAGGGRRHAPRDPSRDQHRLAADGRGVVRPRRDDGQAGRGHPARDRPALSHTYYIASARRDVAEDPDMAWPDSYCPSNPESYRIYFDILDEYIDVLRPKRVHIGHDEWRVGAFCPRCRGKDTGRLFADDVLEIHHHLKQKGLETWMWGDHFVDGHNRFAKQWSEGGVVRYEKPDTTSARDRIAAETREIRILNWSGPK